MSEPVVALAVPECRCARISPDGTSVLTFGAGVVRVWDAATGQRGWSRDWPAPAEFPVEASWSGDSTSIMMLAGARLGLLDAVTGQDLPLPGEVADRTDVTAMAWSAGEPAVAVGTHEGNVLLWRQDAGRVTSLHGGGDPVTALAWRPGTGELCVARPRSLQLWQPADEAMTSSMNVGDVHPVRLVWVPDGDLIVVAGLLEVRLLSLVTRGDSMPPLLTHGSPTGLGISRTGTTLLVGMPDGSIELFDRRLGRTGLGPATVPVALTEPACLHVNETGMVAARATATSVTLFALPDTDLPAPERRRSAALHRWVARAVLPADAADAGAVRPRVPTKIADKSGFAWTDDGWCLQDSTTGEVTCHARDGQRQWTAEAAVGELSAGSGFVAISGARGRVTVLDATTGARVASVPGTGHATWSARAMVVPAPNRRDLLVYDLAFAQPPKTLPVQTAVGDPRWSPDGATLAAVVSDAVVLWDGDTLARARRLDLGTVPGRARVSWAPDGAGLAFTHQNAPVTVWNTATWRADPEHIPSGREAGVALAWSPDARLLAVPADRPIGGVDLWEVRRRRVVLTVPPPPGGRRAVATLHWAGDGRFAVGYDDGSVFTWAFTAPPPPREGQAPLAQLIALVTATAVVGAAVPAPLLADLLCLLLGRDAGPLAEFDRHPGVALLRGLRWPPEAVVGLATLVASGLPAEEELRAPEDVGEDEIRAAVEQALTDSARLPVYDPPIAALLREFDAIDDSVVLLATLLGPDAVAAAPDLLTRIRSQSFGGWSLAPRQQRLLGLRSLLRADGRSQGHGLGDTRAGVARHGEFPSLLPSQLALPRNILGVKLARDELLFRTREGELAVEAQPVVLILDDTPAAFGAVGVTLRVFANLLAAVALRQHRRCALVSLGSAGTTYLSEMADLVRIWARGQVARPDLPAALTSATAAAGQLSDTVGGLPRLVLLTQPHLACPTRSGLHIIRVHYPGLPVREAAPRTHVVAPDAGPDELHDVIGAVLTDRS